jgi:hypothetical protein
MLQCCELWLGQSRGKGRAPTFAFADYWEIGAWRIAKQLILKVFSLLEPNHFRPAPNLCPLKMSVESPFFQASLDAHSQIRFTKLLQNKF